MALLDAASCDDTCPDLSWLVLTCLGVHWRDVNGHGLASRPSRVKLTCVQSPLREVGGGRRHVYEEGGAGAGSGREPLRQAGILRCYSAVMEEGDGGKKG